MPCQLCGAIRANKSSCPFNEHALSPNQDRHNPFRNTDSGKRFNDDGCIELEGFVTDTRRYDSEDEPVLTMLPPKSHPYTRRDDYVDSTGKNMTLSDYLLRIKVNQGLAEGTEVEVFIPKKNILSMDGNNIKVYYTFRDGAFVFNQWLLW